MITLNLTLDEINALLDVLGRTPTSTGTWPLLVKIRTQAEEQLAKQRAKDSTNG